MPWTIVTGGQVKRNKVKSVLTGEQVREDFLRKGEPISAWAVRNGFSPAHVSNVLSGRNKGARGKSHKIAVLLGMKDGVIVT